MAADAADDAATPRLTGQAAWKAQLDTVEQHNVDCKKKARERTAAATSVSERERRLARQEEVQLRALNERLDDSRS
jgi:hypothetical protein